jgi:hypothetical protein
VEALGGPVEVEFLGHGDEKFKASQVHAIKTKRILNAVK